MASVQKSGQTNIVRPSWLIDCVKQNEKDAGLPDLLLPFEPRYVSKIPQNSIEIMLILMNYYRHMFFTMEDQDEDIKLNVDQFMDSYARDTTVDELKEVCLIYSSFLPLQPANSPAADPGEDAEDRGTNTQTP